MEKRLLIVAEDESLLGRLDRMLWDHGPTSFLPHSQSGGTDDPRQPILLSTGTDAPNLARNMLIADGQWREAALTYDRAFYLFDTATPKELHGWHGSCCRAAKASNAITGRRTSAGSGSRRPKPCCSGRAR